MLYIYKYYKNILIMFVQLNFIYIKKIMNNFFNN